LAPLIDRKLSTPPQVYELLRKRIQSSELPPGEKINERALADWLGVSRTPIREAIRRLAGDGLIHVIPNVGTRVAPVDPARVIECCMIRINLEMVAFAKAASVFTEAVGRRMEVLIDEQEHTIVTGDTMQSMAFDIEFHHQLLQLSGYTIVEELLQKVMGEVLRARHLSIMLPGRSHETIAEHRAILAALRSGDLQDSAAKMQFHLDQSYRAVLKVLQA
jgi:GntR family transcriptional regulator, rspAB operon transcriptional repressor